MPALIIHAVPVLINTLNRHHLPRTNEGTTKINALIWNMLQLWHMDEQTNELYDGKSIIFTSRIFKVNSSSTLPFQIYRMCVKLSAVLIFFVFFSFVQCVRIILWKVNVSVCVSQRQKSAIPSTKRILHLYRNDICTMCKNIQREWSERDKKGFGSSQK